MTRFVEKEYSLENLCNAILSDRLHVLIYPEIGMHPLTIRLASLRLAPVQCVSWGHPTTSGIPTIDYFLSSDLMEPKDGENHYTETLIRLPNLGVYYPRPEKKAVDIVVMERIKSDLKKAAVLYICAQSLYKYLPQYDEVFARIAQRAGDCQFIFLTDTLSKPVVNVFRRRLDKAFSQYGLDSKRYLVFYPTLNADEYAGLLRSADIYLDSFGWAGCNTTLEAIACDLPVVTLPGAMMRGRHSMAILKMMGIPDTIARSIDDYIDTAVRLGTDTLWRKQVSERVAANKHRLYDDTECIHAMELFLEKAVADSKNQWNKSDV